jgi:hypothetical protein
MATSITTQIDIKTEQPGHAAARQSPNVDALLSRLGTVVAVLPESSEKTQLVGLIRQAQQGNNLPAQQSGTIPAKRAVRID